MRKVKGAEEGIVLRQLSRVSAVDVDICLRLSRRAGCLQPYAKEADGGETGRASYGILVAQHLGFSNEESGSSNSFLLLTQEISRIKMSPSVQAASLWRLRKENAKFGKVRPATGPVWQGTFITFILKA